MLHISISFLYCFKIAEEKYSIDCNIFYIGYIAGSVVSFFFFWSYFPSECLTF